MDLSLSKEAGLRKAFAMNADGATRWIHQLAEGDEGVAQKLWDRYYGQLVRHARRKLGERHRRSADEEDVVVSAFNSFWQGMRAGRFPDLQDSDDLWRLLMTITGRKAVAVLRREHALKRGEGQIRGESVFMQQNPDDENAGIAAVLGDEPTPQFAAMVAEQYEQLLACLGGESLAQTAQLKLEGYSNTEIARELDCARETVQRRLARIRKKWERNIDDE